MARKRKKSIDDLVDEDSAEMERQEVEARIAAVASMAGELETALTTAWRIIISLPNDHDWGARQSDVDFVERVVDKLHKVRGY